MIGIALILGATIILGSTLLARYWNKAIEFLKNTIHKLQEKFASARTLMGSSIFIRKFGDKYQNRTKHYSKDKFGHWKETIVTYEQQEEEIPEEYKNKASETEEYDLTEQLELQLSES